jgi:hypothetical protein
MLQYSLVFFLSFCDFLPFGRLDQTDRSGQVKPGSIFRRAGYGVGRKVLLLGEIQEFYGGVCSVVVVGV